MLVTGPDPRLRWQGLREKAVLGPGEEAELRAMPAGAREAPLDWLCTTQQEQRGHFDKDEQGEVMVTCTHVTGWRSPPHVGLSQARAISFYGVDTFANGVLTSFPHANDGLTALTIEGVHLAPTWLATIGRARPWEDVAIWGARWSPAARAAGVRELAAAFPRLRGLDLYSARLDEADVAALGPIAGRLEDLTLTDCPAVDGLIDRLGSLVHLDLRSAQLGPAAIARLAPKLRRAKRLMLNGNPIGDAGLRSLLPACAEVEDLWLGDTGLTDAGLRALIEAAPPRLRGLWIDSNALTDAGVEALAKSRLFGQLHGLSLWQRGLGARAQAALAGHPLAGALSGTTRLPGVHALWFLGRPDGA